VASLLVMELTEIPSVVLKIFRYTSSTRRSWLISIVLVLSITVLVFDLSYSFVYNRVHNVNDTKYDSNYWIILAIATVSASAFYMAYSFFSYKYKLRKFGGKKYGVGIVPFDVISINPDTLSSFEKMRTLDEVMYQLFLAINLLLDDDDYSNEFEIRTLPPGLKIHNQQSSIKLLKKLNAVLIIRGILKEDTEGHSLDLFFEGGDKLMLSDISIILKKDIIDSIANMIRISSYVSISMLKWKDIDQAQIYRGAILEGVGEGTS
jgi:hypothetical protein